ncbi:hypothetical protein ACFWN1_17625 [Streptomyces sp. NPDC058459]|uniref:hypothetical protein n=1 Tax=Streptomyces sp. NPDC058459 TaxID=3346508 RepID=UPI0036539F54
MTATALGAVYGADALAAHGDRQRPGPVAEPSVQTVRVRRTDLSDSQTVPATLGFGGRTTVKGPAQGIVTALPGVGATARRGRTLYRVDDRPVTVFYGDTPFFRPLDKPGPTGHDVTVLADNLRALGYELGPGSPPAARTGPDTGTKLTAGVLAALERWQHDTGLPATGRLDPGHALVLPGPARVDSVGARLGDSAAEEVLQLTSLQKTVTAKLDLDSARPVRKGGAVEIILPDDRHIKGRVTSVGTTVQGGTGSDDTQDAGAPPSVTVTVVPVREDDVAAIDAASVQVVFADEVRRHVLVVPVGALLALSEGGYALQRPDGRLVGVKTGLIARGLVEVTGDGVSEGDTVVTAG